MNLANFDKRPEKGPIIKEFSCVEEFFDIFDDNLKVKQISDDVLRCEHEFEAIEDDYFVCKKCGMEKIYY